MAEGYQEVFDEIVEVGEDPNPASPNKSKKHFKIMYESGEDDSQYLSFREGKSPRKRTVRKYPQMIHYMSEAEDSTIDSDFFDSKDDDKIADPDHFRPHKYLARSSPVRVKQPQSILEWFDKSIDAEIQQRLDATVCSLDLMNTEGTGNPIFEESTVYEHDLMDSMKGDMNTDMNDAINCFVKAQALVSFEGAVRAAEHAAANAPPGHAEEAAVAGAKGYQAQLTGMVRQKLPGIKPVEVLGYVGITKPKFRKRRS